MALMRDRQTGVVREVSERWLARWPDDYEPVKTKGRQKPADETATAEPNESAGGTTEGES